MNRIRKTSSYCFALCLLFVSSVPIAAAASGTEGTDREMSNNSRQDITITCPADITYQIEPISDGWDATLHRHKKLRFQDATLAGRILYCNYSTRNGSLNKDSSVLMREAPAGYICKVYQGGGLSRAFLCKRAVPLIKIKPKSK